MMDERAPIERLADLDGLTGWIEPMALSRVGMVRDAWCIWARPDQLPPPWHWNVWLMMAGRGFGKTRAGAEWVHWKARQPGVRIALVGPSEDETRRVMIEGASGVLSCGPQFERPAWEPSRGQLSWPNGSTAHVYSGAHADGLRGPEHEFAWADEIAKWAQVDDAWSNLRFGLRRGRHPQAMVTTTPRSIDLLRRLKVAPDVAVTGGSTLDNRHNAASYAVAMTADYGGTRLGRQEIYGELIDDVEGALWKRDMLEACRVREAPEQVRVVVGVDPPAGTMDGPERKETRGDACGIVVCGLGRDGFGYVIEDASVAARSPQAWALAVAQAAARHGADRVVAEANNGGKMVETVLRAADSGLPVKLVHASRGKAARAEPVALCYEAGKVRHIGAFPELEDELCGLIAGGGYEGPGRSPDRADACVWALSELMLGRRNQGPQVRLL